jgi:transcriptional regulator with PAS, ATPase and Fis domain
MKWLPRYASYTNENPLILGATGTGKTNLARALHNLSGRKGQFVSITPRDFSSSELVQVELFGSVAGAYTGAVDKWGLVKSAEGGTLFIDELQSIDKELQGKLITFIENKAYRRVGSAESIEADVRFVFASNRTLYDMMQTETLRDDFAYRLERVQLDLRPLESRRLDICAALAYALAKIRRQRPLQNHITGLNSSAYRQLLGGHWPGNLRQLENSTARLCELADMDGKSLIEEQMVRQVMESTFSSTLFTTSEVLLQAAHRLSAQGSEQLLNNLKEGVEQFVEFARVMALEATGGDLQEAADLIQEDPRLLELMAQSILSRRELH